MFIRLKKTILLVLCLSFCAGTFIQGMEKTPKKKKEDLLFVSPSQERRSIVLDNYCRKIIQAASEGDPARVKEAFTDFFNKFTCEFFKFKANKGYEIEKNFDCTDKFFCALFYSLIECLREASVIYDAWHEHIRFMKEKPINRKKFKNGPTFFYIPFKGKKRVFVLQLCVCVEDKFEESTYDHFNYRYNKKTVDTCSVTVWLSREKNGISKYQDTRIKWVSASDEIDKNQKQVEDVDECLWDMSERSFFEGNCYKMAIRSIQDGSVDLFKLLFQSVVKNLYYRDLSPTCERYFHGLVGFILIFMGVDFVELEEAAGKGYIDIYILCANNEHIIFEFKFATPDGTRIALDQIKNNDYARPFNGTCYLVGVNLTKDMKVKVSMEKLEKNNKITVASPLDFTESRIAEFEPSKSEEKEEEFNLD